MISKWRPVSLSAREIDLIIKSVYYLFALEAFLINLFDIKIRKIRINNIVFTFVQTLTNAVPSCFLQF